VSDGTVPLARPVALASRFAPRWSALFHEVVTTGPSEAAARCFGTIAKRGEPDWQGGGSSDQTPSFSMPDVPSLNLWIGGPQEMDLEGGQELRA